MRVMSADWTTCRVVRDRDGDLWFRGCDSDDLWTANTNYPDVFLTADELHTAFGGLTPVLDADGQPVVRTVGDLTARHLGRRVRVDGWGETYLSAVERLDRTLSAVLPDLLAGAWDEGRKVGLRQADWEYGVTPYPMPELANPYRTERADHE